MFNFLPSTEENRLWVQASNGRFYYLSAASVFASAYAGSSAANKACFSQYRDTFFITNGKNFPQVGTIDEALPDSFLKSLDAAVTFIDYTDEVQDTDATTHAALDALNTLANGDAIYVRFGRPLSGAKFYVDATNKNAIVSVLAVHYYNGAWTAVSGLAGNDGTDVGGATMAKTGWVTWTIPTDAISQTIDGKTGHWYRFTVSVALSATVDVTKVRCRAPIQKIQNLWDGQYQPVHGAWFTAAGVNKNIHGDMVDGVKSVGINIGGMSAANLYFGFADRVRGFKLSFLQSPTTEINAVSAALSMSCWNGTAWAGVTITDGTKVGNPPFAQDGEINFIWPTAAEKRYVNSTMGLPLYWFVFKTNAAITNPTTIVEAQVIPETYIEDSWKFRFCSIFKQRLFLARSEIDPNMLYFSAARLPESFDGDDAGYLEVGPGYPIQFLMPFYHYLVIGLKGKGGVYVLEGYNPATFGLMKIGTAECISSNSIAIIDLRDKGGGEFGFFLARDGIYRVEGVSCLKITDAFDDLFDVNSALYIDFNNVEAQGYGTVYKSRNWYACAVPLRTSGGAQTTNNYWLVYNYVTQATFIFDIAAASIGTYIDALKQDRLIHGGYSDGDVYLDDDDANLTDNGAAITAIGKTGQLSFADSFQRAIVRDMIIRHKLASDNLYLSAYPFDQSAALGRGSILLSGSGYASRWRGKEMDVEGDTMALRFMHNHSSTPPIIYDMRFHFTIEQLFDRR